MLTVLTSSTSDKLAHLQGLKDHLGITTTSADDLLTDQLGAATDAVITELGYWPLRQRYRETVGGYGDLTMMLSRTPIRSVYQITVGSQVVDATTYVVDRPDAGVIRREQGFPWTAGIEWDLDAHIASKSERHRFTVDYEAGWVLTTSTDPLSAAGFLTITPGTTVPRDIQQAVIEAAKSMYLSRKRDSTINSKSVGDLSVTYSNVKTGLPAEALALLQRYKRYA